MVFCYLNALFWEMHLLFCKFQFWSEKCTKTTEKNCNVICSRFGSFLRSELKFSKLPVQSSHQCVTCAHEKNSFSFIWTRCECFGTSMHMIMYNSLLFPTLSIAYIMLIEMYCNGLYGIVSPPQHLGISSSSLYMQNGWTSCHMSSLCLYISIHWH